MLKKRLIYFASLVLMAIQIPSFAVLNLELTKGVDRAIPIALVPFQNSKTAPLDVSEVITHDLKNSGQFKLLDLDAISQFPHDLKSVDFDYWRGLSIDNLVIGTLQPNINDSYEVNFSLLDIYRNNIHEQIKSRVSAMMKTGFDPVLLSQSFEKIKSADLRPLAHHIADLIYQKLTGIKGIFSTRIAYVLVKHNQFGQPIKFYLEVADADGYNPQPILISPEPILSPAWSPDGQRLAYVSLEKNRAAIYISDVATGQRKLLTDFPGINGAPAWSPDGKKVALVLSKDESPKIYIMDLKTRKLRQITHGWSIDTEPAFSPNGQSLIFTSDRGGGPQIYQVNLSDGFIKRLTFEGDYNARASFTPDGESIVMLHREAGNFNIAIQDLGSGNMTVLSHASDDQSPSVAPNGKMVIYASQSGDQGILEIVSTDGQVRLNLPATDGEVREPVWGRGY
ncbi:MAG: Tol-Pal system beta propeller repeat protein TolB [Gammaproteobacteria bacterium]|nr:Tol-Pal system beta propeller repeat protein TolB [Gammaproteobacteria bacterium]